MLLGEKTRGDGKGEKERADKSLVSYMPSLGKIKCLFLHVKESNGTKECYKILLLLVFERRVGILPQLSLHSCPVSLQSEAFLPID